MGHFFPFDGGEYLTTIGASWFISYAFYDHIDKNHIAWHNIKTWPSRKSTYCRTREYHHEWLEQILKMNNVNLNKNTLGLTAAEVKSMAAQLIKIV